MKRKELMKRALALALSAMMTIGNLPAVTYASEIPQVENGGVIQTEESDIPAEETEESQIPEAASEDPETAPEAQSQAVEQSEAEPQATEGEQVVVQDAQEDEGATEDEEARNYLETKYINGKISSSNITKGEDNLTYTIGLTTPSGGELRSIYLSNEGSTGSYKSGWYIAESDYLTTTALPTKIGKLSINRPEHSTSVTATLKLFSKETSDDDINAGKAKPLATQDFTLIVLAKETEEQDDTLTVVVQDENANPITDAEITLEKDWSTVSPQADGSYKLEKNGSYTLTVKKEGYKDSKTEFTYTGDKSSLPGIITLKKIVKRTIKFIVQDQNKSELTNAKVKVKEGYYDVISPETDGSYKLDDGTTYTYEVTCTNYKQFTGTITPSKDDNISVELEKDISSYAVNFQPMDGETPVEEAKISVWKWTEDDYDEDVFDWELITANNGYYTLEKGEKYKYTVEAEGYKSVTVENYKPSGDDETYTITVPMDRDQVVSEEDQATVDAVKKIFDGETGNLRASYQYKNIKGLMQAKLASDAYSTVTDATNVTVTVVTSSDADVIDLQGDIHYITADQLNNASNIYSATTDVVLKFSLNGATAESKSRRVIVGWDQKHFVSKMNEEASQLTWDTIKGENTEQTNVASSLTLPQCMGTSLPKVWSRISWESSDPSVINVQTPNYDNEDATGVVTPQAEDKTVTLTATFSANERVLNTNVEKVTDFGNVIKTFTVTVKGTGETGSTEEELQNILDTYYTADRLQDFNTKETLDTTACTGDIQLPRYTYIEDADGNEVFANQEINVTSSNESVITISGRRAVVDVFAVEKATTVNLIISFTRNGITVTKEIPITVLPNADLENEVQMMEYAKEHYFDGIKGDNVSKDKITENLHAFQEMYFDAEGNAVWEYVKDNVTGKGICADSFFDDDHSEEMEGAGYNKFKSSNNAVIQHENLVVHRPESPTQVTITSWLSSERYGQFAETHKDNKTLQKLYKQEVSVTVTVQPEIKATEQLQKAIDKLQDLLDSVTEGNGAGQYPAGTKDKLQQAIEEAEALLNSENPADADLEAKAAELTSLLDTVQATQNETEATVTVKMNTEAGKGMDVSKLTVKAYTAEKYGYKKADVNKNKITVMDALVAWHAMKYGDAFTKNPTEYLIVGENGWISKIFGVGTSAIGFLVNNASTGSATANEACLVSGDSLSVFRYAESANYQDFYLYFEGVPETVKAKTQVAFTLFGTPAWGGTPVAQSGYTVAAVDEKGNTAATAVTDADGKAVLQINAAGNYQIVVTETPKDSTVAAYILPKDLLTVTALASDGLTIPTIDEKTDLGKLQIKDGDTVLKEGVDYTVDKKTEGQTVTVKITFIGAYTGEVTRTYTVTPQEPPKHTHSFGPWYTVAAATTTSPERQERVCTCGEKETRTVGEPLKAPEVHEHSYGAWYTVSAATVFAAEVQERVCACGEKETRTVGTALEKTIKVNMSYIPLKVKQTTTKFKVSGLAAGDSVASYTSSNKKIFTVDKNGKLKAGKKKGSAKLTITLKSGLKKTVTVKVQKTKVKTKKIQNLTKTIVLKKGNKTTLKPVLNPLTSQQGIRYYSSKKSVARVSSKGVITAKKAGKATITVKSGSKKFRITVKVK